MANKYIDVKKGEVERIDTPWYSVADGGIEFALAPTCSIYNESQVVLDDFNALNITEYTGGSESSVRATYFVDTSDAAFVIGDTYILIITSILDEDRDETQRTEVYTVRFRVTNPLT